MIVLLVTFAMLAGIGWALWYSERDRRLNAERIARLAPESSALTVRSPESIETRATKGARGEAMDDLIAQIEERVSQDHPDKTASERSRIAREIVDGLKGGAT